MSSTDLWAALGGALSGLGQGLDENYRRKQYEEEQARKAEQDKLARDQYERQMEIMQNQDEQAQARLFADLLKGAPPGNDVTGLVNAAPERYRPGLQGLAEPREAHTNLPSAALSFGAPSSVVDEAVGTQAPGDVIGQALAGQRPLASLGAPSGMGNVQPGTTTPGGWNATGTAAAQQAAERTKVMQNELRRKEDADRRVAEIQRQKMALDLKIAQLQQQGANDRNAATIAAAYQRQANDLAQELVLAQADQNTAIYRVQATISTANARNAAGGMDPLTMLLMSNLSGGAGGGMNMQPQAPPQIQAPPLPPPVSRATPPPAGGVPGGQPPPQSRTGSATFDPKTGQSR